MSERDAVLVADCVLGLTSEPIGESNRAVIAPCVSSLGYSIMTSDPGVHVADSLSEEILFRLVVDLGHLEPNSANLLTRTGLFSRVPILSAR